MASRRLLSPSSSCTMHRPSFLRSHSTKPSNPHQPQPSSAPEEGSDTPTLARPGLSTRATLTSNISKGLAAIAGTAATVGGNVGHYAKGAVKGDATMLGGDEGGWRDSIGGWVGKKKSAFPSSLLFRRASAGFLPEGTTLELSGGGGRAAGVPPLPSLLPFTSTVPVILTYFATFRQLVDRNGQACYFPRLGGQASDQARRRP